MSNTRLGLGEPLMNLGASTSAHKSCSTKALAVFCMVGGLVFTTALLSAGDRNTATSMIANPLAFHHRTAAVAPSAAFLPKVQRDVSADAISRATKESQVALLKDRLDKSGIVVVTKNMGGLTVGQTNAMRQKLKGSNATYQVIKNTLAKIAMQGTDYEKFYDVLEGPMGLLLADDPVEGAKAIVEVLEDLNGEKKKPEDMKLKVEGAITEGQLIDEAGIEKLSKMPSIEESRTKLAILLNQPATKVAQTINAVPQLLARVLQVAIDEKKFPEA
eukprot:gnl/MRDRNA2_/MRDRNA2_101143_c0_seq1.p1 gnl/MRDRNA2_/MRDRNA2_101143_c0~~gnl/MRDRNA2_/MRDRNA2_101143_c0_seq1.p1  ORF type:complete len:274 (+),score=65.44 gnl/MRDRNA2_/MRDRNA2_101143_c0_seq1:126-947(+)